MAYPLQIKNSLLKEDGNNIKLVKNNNNLTFITDTKIGTSQSPDTESDFNIHHDIFTKDGIYLSIVNNNSNGSIFKSLRRGNTNSIINNLNTISLQLLPTTNKKYLSINHLIPCLYEDMYMNTLDLGIYNTSSAYHPVGMDGCHSATTLGTYMIDGLCEYNVNEHMFYLRPCNMVNPLYISYISLQCYCMTDCGNCLFFIYCSLTKKSSSCHHQYFF